MIYLIEIIIVIIYIGMTLIVFKDMKDDMKGLTEEKLHEMRKLEDEEFYK